MSKRAGIHDVYSFFSLSSWEEALLIFMLNKSRRRARLAGVERLWRGQISG